MFNLEKQSQFKNNKELPIVNSRTTNGLKNSLEKTGDSDLEEINEIKKLQDNKNDLIAAILLKKTGITKSEQADLIYKEGSGKLYEDVLTSDYYLTDTVGNSEKNPESEGRILMSSEEMIQYFNFLKKEGLKNNPENFEEVEEILNEYYDFIKTKRKILTRPGADSVIDLLNDSILNEQFTPEDYSDNISEEARLENNLKLKEEHDKKLSELTEKINQINNRTELQILSPRISPESLPLEIKVLILKNPEVASLIDKLSTEHTLAFKTKTGTDENVIEAIHDISTLTQHKYQTNWLENLLKKGQNPKLTLGDDLEKKGAAYEVIKVILEEKISKNQEDLEKNSGKSEKYLKKQMKLEKNLSRIEKFLTISDKKNLVKDLEEKLDLIKSAQTDYKEFVCLDEEKLGVEDRENLKKMNKLNKDLNDEYASRRLQFDLSDNQSSEAQDTIKKMMIIGPIAHVLELCDLGAVAKLCASSADDVLGEWAEIQALMGAGYSKNEVLKRMNIALPVFALATYGANKVEKLLRNNKELLAGATFGVTAVALSLATAFQSMKMYKNGYDSLVKEGKISGTSFIASNPEFKKKFKEFSNSMTDFSKDKLLLLIKKVLTEINPEKNLLNEDEEKDLIYELEGINDREIFDLINKNINVEAWEKAIKQDFNNPVRLGILIGSASAPVLGMGAASLGLLNNGFVLAGVGSVESIAGGLTVMGARRLLDYKWKLYLKQRLNLGKLTFKDSDIGIEQILSPAT